MSDFTATVPARAPKSITIDDQNGTIVTVLEMIYNPTAVRLVVSDLGHGRHCEQALIYRNQAKLLGEWLVAWAKEHEEKPA